MGKQGKTNAQPVAPNVIIDFLKGIMPFSQLEESTLKKLAKHFKIDFFPKGTKLLVAGETDVEHFYLIQQGGVKCYLINEEGEITLKDYRGEGDYIGALGIIRNSKANLNVETVEDTFCFVLPKEIFLELIKKETGFAQYFLKSFSEKYVKTAYSELRNYRITIPSTEDLYLFSVEAKDIIKPPLITVNSGDSIQKAASKMSEHRVGSVLIESCNSPGEIVGIITDRDLREKVVSKGLDYRLPVNKIMSSPVQSVPYNAICFDILVKMMSTGIHHLAVEKDGKIIGVITSNDIVALQGHSPYYFLKEIGKQKTIRGLYPLAQKLPDIIKNLIKEGAKAGNITRITAILNDHIVSRMLTLLEEEMGAPPVGYCWLLMGSEGRREQTFKTDQDNAIVYWDPEDERLAKESREYFSEFAKKAIDHLVNCGYPPCPGNIMASNPKWCQSLSVWEEYFNRWISTPEPEEVLHASIFFDFRGAYGHMAIATTLKDFLIEKTQQDKVYLWHMARETVSAGVPLSFFRNFIVEKTGEHKNKLDIKKHGITPFVNFSRIMALNWGIRETNTMQRLQLLYDNGYIADDLWKTATEAYEFVMQLRLLHQLNQIEEGILPDNYINPGELTDLEKRMLKDAFRVIERLHRALESTFQLR